MEDKTVDQLFGMYKRVQSMAGGSETGMARSGPISSIPRLLRLRM
jgi:hypothetical protein